MKKLDEAMKSRMLEATKKAIGHALTPKWDDLCNAAEEQTQEDGSDYIRYPFNIAVQLSDWTVAVDVDAQVSFAVSKMSKQTVSLEK